MRNDIHAFDRMVRQGAYRHLVGHEEATILLTMRTPSKDVWQGLVRVVPKVEEKKETSDTKKKSKPNLDKKSEEEQLKYWWYLGDD